MMLHNLLRRVMLILAPDNGAGGSADDGKQQTGNAEDSFSSAFGAKGADADGSKPAAKPDGNNAAGDKKPGSGADNSEEIKLAAWTEQLPPEMRSNPQAAAVLAKFGKVGDMAKAFLELESKAAAGGIPGKDAKPEEVQAFWEKAGRPKTADGYSFAKDKENQGAVFADIAHKANLTAAQAEAIFKNMTEIGKQHAQSVMQAREAREKETEAALKKEFGSKYAEKRELLIRGLEKAGPNVGALLKQAGLDSNQEIIKAFIEFGEMTAESGATRGKEAGGDDAFKPTAQGGTFS